MNTARKITKRETELIEKIRSLTPERIAEVEDFIEFLRLRSEERELIRTASRLSEASLKRVWDNQEDSVYDQL